MSTVTPKESQEPRAGLPPGPLLPAQRRLGRVIWLLSAGLPVIAALHVLNAQLGRQQTRTQVHGWGGVVTQQPLLPEILAPYLPGERGAWFWSLELVAFNDRSFDSSRLSELARSAGVAEIRKLYLNGTGVDSAGLSTLSAFQRVEELYLEDTVVDDHGLAALPRLSRLRVISLRNTRVTQGGVEKLRKVRPGLEILGWMNMRHGPEEPE